MLPFCFIKEFFPHFNQIRQIHVKPTNFSIVHPRKTVIESAPDIDADRIEIFPEQFFHRFVKQNRPCDNTLMGKEPIQLFGVNVQLPDNFNRLIIVYSRHLPFRFICPDRQRYQSRFLNISQILLRIRIFHVNIHSFLSINDEYVGKRHFFRKNGFPHVLKIKPVQQRRQQQNLTDKRNP